MYQIKGIGRVLLVLFSLAMLCATTASAEEGTLPQQTKPFTIASGGEAIIENLNKEPIKCTGFTGEGTFLTKSDQHATGTLTYTGCKASGFSANTLGTTSGIIKYPTLFLICLVEPKPLAFGMLIEPTESPVHIEVPALKVLLLLKGAVIALNLSPLSGKEFLLDLVATGGDQETALECKINEETFKHSLETGIDTKADTMASEEAAITVKFGEVVELMDT
jgi:hypothetical protein